MYVFNKGGGGPAEPRRRRNLGGRPQSVHGGLHGEIERGDILSEVVLGAALRLRGVSLCGECVCWQKKRWQFHSGNTHPEVWGSHRQPQEQRWRQAVEELKSNLLALTHTFNKMNNLLIIDYSINNIWLLWHQISLIIDYSQQSQHNISRGQPVQTLAV